MDTVPLARTKIQTTSQILTTWSSTSGRLWNAVQPVPVSCTVMSIFLCTSFRSAGLRTLWNKCRCYAHGDICKMCGWFGNPWRVGGVSDPGSSSPSFLLSFFARSWGLERFYPDSMLAFWTSWVPGGWWCEQVVRSATLSFWTHTRRERKCIAGLPFTVHRLQSWGVASPLCSNNNMYWNKTVWFCTRLNT
jgi:hypothetical protein